MNLDDPLVCIFALGLVHRVNDRREIVFNVKVGLLSVTIPQRCDGANVQIRIRLSEAHHRTDALLRDVTALKWPTDTDSKLRLLHLGVARIVAPGANEVTQIDKLGLEARSRVFVRLYEVAFALILGSHA